MDWLNPLKIFNFSQAWMDPGCFLKRHPTINKGQEEMKNAISELKSTVEESKAG